MGEVEALLEFVRASLEMGKRTDDMDIRIVANVRDSLFEVRPRPREACGKPLDQLRLAQGPL
jgi:hypothetical protein